MKKRDLEELRWHKNEVRELRGKALQAKLCANELETPEERERAAQDWARYSALADVMNRETEEIELAIYSLPKYEWRQVLSLRFVDGWSVEKVAQRMHYSPRTVLRLTKEALEMLEREGSE